MIYVKLWRRCKIWDFRSKICIDQFKSKREFYRDSIFNSRIVSIDLSGEFRKNSESVLPLSVVTQQT